MQQELIESRGFKHETHFVTSEDGYILQLVRIVNPHLQNSSKKLKPVLLHHGYPCSGAIWLIAANGNLRADGRYVEEEDDDKEGARKVGNSLGFVLASSGHHYDVWLANSRGNVYSSNHSSLSTESDAFWAFSLDEIIRYDLPALIEHIRAVSKQSQVAYIGHSQGTLMMFGLLSSQPKYNEIVAPFIALSPVTSFEKVDAPLETIRGQAAHIRRLFPRHIFTLWSRRLGLARACTNPLLQSTICFWGYRLIWGSGRSQLDLERMPVLLDNSLQGSSTANCLHLLQLRASLAHLDLGSPEANVARYGRPTPPPYNYSAITNRHIAIFYLLQDWYLHVDNVEALKKALRVKLCFEYAVPDQSWNHMDLVWGRDVGREVNSRVLQVLRNY